MIRKHWWQSIAAQLWLMILWCAVFLGGLIALNTQAEAGHERAAVGAALQRRGEAQAALLRTTLSPANATVASLVTLSRQPAVAELGSACSALLQPLQQAVSSGFIGVVDGSGTMLCAGSPRTAGQLHRFSTASVVTALVRSGKSATGGPFVDPCCGALSLVSAAPLAGSPARALVYVTPTQTALLPQDSDKSFTSIVVDGRSGQVLMHYPALSWAVGREITTEPLGSVLGTSGVRSVRGLDGTLSLYRSVAVAGTPYQVLVGQSDRSAYADVRRNLRRNLLLSVMAMLALVLMGWVLHYRVTRPVRRVQDAIRAIAHDPDAGPAPTDGPTELAAVAQAFNETTQARRRADGLSRAILQHSSDHVLVIDNDYRLSFLAPRAQRVLGLRAGQTATTMADRIHPDDRARVMRLATEWASHRGRELQAETRLYVADGSLRHVEVHGQDLRDDPYVSGLVLTCRDVTDRKEWEQHLAHQARHDPLTGLANRTLILERLQAQLEDPSRQPVAVCFVDLDRFKLINDSHGHAVGDRVLAALARRLERAVRPSDIVGRFGGDEFVVVGSGIGGEIEALALAERVQSALAEPLRILRRDLFVSGSIGIALGEHGDSAETILRNADTAMYRGKELGRNTVAFFDEIMQADAQRRLRTENDLHRALERDELTLHYQPLVSLGDEHTLSVEALVRWKHPQRGLVPPAEFIPIAEETGLIVPIGEWVLREACSWAAAAAERLQEPVRVAVNISARQLGQPHFVDLVYEVLTTSGLPARMLCLEVTETVLVEDAEGASGTLSALHDSGVQVAIDDFGTGWSSLTYLQQFPVDEIKLDRSYVSRVENDPASATIVGSMVQMAHAMGLSVTAEGVETPGQEAFLRARGCDTAQGYLYSKPVDGATAEHLIGTRTRLVPVPRGTMEP